MIFQLIKRDPAWRIMPLLTLAFGVIGALWHFFTPAATNFFPRLLLSETLTGLIVAVIASASAQNRDTPFQSTLPVTVRQVFLSRMLSMFALLWLPVIAGLIALAALKDPLATDLTLAPWLVFTCFVLGIECILIRGLTIPPWLYPTLAAVCAGSMTLAGDLQVWSAELALAACCAAFVLLTWRDVPKSFQDAPMRGPSALPQTAVRIPRSTPSWKTALRIILRTTGVTPLSLFVVTFLLGVSSNPFLYIILVTQWAVTRTRARWIFAFPIPPRVLLAAIMLPTMFALTAGYIVSIHLPWLPLPIPRGVAVRRTQDLFGRHLFASANPQCRTPNVLPALEYWLPIPTAEAPLIQAPWGETFQPAAYRESGFNVYNPYAVGCENSERFLNWQFRKATIAIYGRPIPLDKSVDPYVEQTPVTGLRTQLVSVEAIVGLSMLNLLLAMAFDWHWFHPVSKQVRIAISSLIGAAIGGLILLIAFRNVDVIQSVSWSLPSSLSGAISVASLALILIYLALDRLFHQVEFTDKAPPPR